MSISLNSLKHGGMRSVMTNWPYTDPSRQLRIGRFSRKSSRRLNIYFSMTKFKKLHWKTRNLETSWIGSKSVKYQQLKYYNITDILASKSIIYGRYYTKHSTWLKTVKLIPAYWIKSYWNPPWNNYLSLRKNSRVLSTNVTIHLPLG